jgi:hypothetical protein
MCDSTGGTTHGTTGGTTHGTTGGTTHGTTGGTTHGTTGGTTHGTTGGTTHGTTHITHRFSPGTMAWRAFPARGAGRGCGGHGGHGGHGESSYPLDRRCLNGHLVIRAFNLRPR